MGPGACWLLKSAREILNWKGPITNSKKCFWETCQGRRGACSLKGTFAFHFRGVRHATQKNVWISKALERYFLHFEGRFIIKTNHSSQSLIIQFNKQILGFNNYKYSIYCITKCMQSQYYGIVLNTVNWKPKATQTNSKAKLNTLFF